MPRHALILPLLAASFAPSVFSLPAADNAVPLEKRQGTIGVPFFGWVGTEISQAISGPPNFCDKSVAPKPPNKYWLRKGSGPNDIRTDTCWLDGPDPFVFARRDVDVVNCLTHLHHVQKDACISVEGSACDLDGYKAAGGKVNNLRKPTGLSSNKAAPLTGEESLAYQAAWNAMVDRQVAQSSLVVKSCQGKDCKAATQNLVVNWDGGVKC